MKKVKGISLVILMAILPSANAFAEGERYVMGLGVGKSKFQFNETEIIAGNPNLSNATTFDDNSTVFSLFAGFRFDEHLSLEFDVLLDAGIVARDNGRTFNVIDIDSLATTLALSTQVAENMRVFGRLGVHSWQIKTRFDDATTDSFDLTYGLGADINLYGDLSRQMRIQWNHYEYDGVLVNNSDAITFSLIFMY